MIGTVKAMRAWGGCLLQSPRHFSAHQIATRAVVGLTHGSSRRRAYAPAASSRTAPASGLFPLLTPSSLGKNLRHDPHLGVEAGTFPLQALQVLSLRSASQGAGPALGHPISFLRGHHATRSAQAEGGMHPSEQIEHAPGGLGL